MPYARRFGTSLLLAALAAVCVGLALDGRTNFERLVGMRPRARPRKRRARDFRHRLTATIADGKLVSRDPAGSSIDSSSFPSAALRREGSFLVYLPPGYANTAMRYPVIYLLHGNEQTDDSFLQIGLQGTLDRLISRHAIPPTIAIMIQGGRGANEWRTMAPPTTKPMSSKCSGSSTARCRP